MADYCLDTDRIDEYDQIITNLVRLSGERNVAHPDKHRLVILHALHCISDRNRMLAGQICDAQRNYFDHINALNAAAFFWHYALARIDTGREQEALPFLQRCRTLCMELEGERSWLGARAGVFSCFYQIQADHSGEREAYLWDVLRKIEAGFYSDMDQSAEDIAARIRRVLLSIHVDHQNIGALSLETACAADQTTIHDTVKTITAVIHLAIHTAKAALEQIEAGADNWLFCSAPMALAGVRSLSQKPASDTKKIIDTANSQTFVAYDAVQKLLVIQIDAADCGTAPRAFVKWSDRTIEVELEKRENLFWGQVRDLPEGEYEILLEK